MADAVPPEELQKKKLGEIEICDKAFKLDLKINDGYQDFSKELLRLALLAIGGVSTVWLRIYLDTDVSKKAPPSVGYLLLIASYLLAISAGLSLLHRYWAADSLAYHLTSLRRLARNRPKAGKFPGDEALAKTDMERRDLRFKRCGSLLKFATVFLGAGVIFFVAALYPLMKM